MPFSRIAKNQIREAMERYSVLKPLQSYAAALIAAFVTSACGASSSIGTGPSQSPAPLRTIVAVTGGTLPAGPTTPAQSVTITGGTFNNIRFAWAKPTNFSPIAPTSGGLYILALEYLGPISGLSTATPGAIAKSTGIEGDEFVFDPSVTLQPGTYWFVADREQSLVLSRGNLDVYPDGSLNTGGLASIDNEFTRFWIRSPTETFDANFTLRGAAAPGGVAIDSSFRQRGRIVAGS